MTHFVDPRPKDAEGIQHVTPRFGVEGDDKDHSSNDQVAIPLKDPSDFRPAVVLGLSRHQIFFPDVVRARVRQMRTIAHVVANIVCLRGWDNLEVTIVVVAIHHDYRRPY